MIDRFFILALLATALEVYGGEVTCPAQNCDHIQWREASMSEKAETPSMDRLVHLAMLELSRRLNVDLGDIEVIEARAVVWPDRSFGCPRPGLNYPQVQQDGAMIRLRVGAQQFAFHSGGSRPPFLCEKLP
jgi:hypothetical protein